MKTENTAAFLDEPFRTLWKGKDLFAEVFALKGELFRHVKNRTTIRFTLDGKRFFFLKIHRGVGWREIFKNLFQFKKPVLGAENEYFAIRKMEELGLHTMTARAYGSRYRNPAARESFLITDEVTEHITLEDVGKRNALDPLPEKCRKDITRNLALTAGKMHFAGLNHRDCYLCHFMIPDNFENTGNTDVLVMDLHRAEIRQKIPRRMQVKDLAGLFFSAMDAGLGKRDFLRFRSIYSSLGKLDPAIWADVEKTAIRLYRKEFGRNPEKVADFIHDASQGHSGKTDPFRV